MTFEAAKRKLAKIAKGEYHAIQYEICVASKEFPGPDEVECGIYIHGKKWYSGPTWDAAFKLLEAGGDRRKKKPVDKKEQPEEEAGRRSVE